MSVAAIAATPGSEEWGTKIRRRARNLIKAIDQGYMELAEIIHTVWATPINGERHNACVTVAWGYDSYVQWAEEELGLHSRQTQRLRAIWHHLHVTLEGKLDRRTQKRIIGLGLSKVRELIRVIDEHNAEQWVEMAEHLNQTELCIAIRQALLDQEKGEQAAAVGANEEEGNDSGEWRGPEPPKEANRYKLVRFNLTPEQKANVELALERAKQLAPTSTYLDPAAYLDLICTDFLSTNDFRKADDPEMPLRFLAKFERLLGKRLVVIDPQHWVIEYGLDALERAGEALEAQDE